MIFTLSQNAVSSLVIAVENFKKAYYLGDKHSKSEINESLKICIIFLENSIELLLKVILVNDDELSIYEHPESKVIQQAISRATEAKPLEDILISEGNFKTISYTETIKRYNDKYYKSDKVYNILNNFGEIRNAIIHFGIDKINSVNELMVDILNVFDIIYNYLYPQLIEIESIQHIFTNDDLIVETIHGNKFLFDENFVYNNIVDFLDELLESANNFAFYSRLSESNNNLEKYIELMLTAITDHKFCDLLKNNNAEIKFYNDSILDKTFDFELIKNNILSDMILSSYSRYYNTTAFCGEGGDVYFLIVHNRNEIYLYGTSSTAYWPQHNEAEMGMFWLEDLNKGKCQRFNLSKRNILKVFDNITSDV